MVDQVRFLIQRFQSVVIAIKAKESGERHIPIRVSRFYTDDDGNIILRYHKIDGEREIDVPFKEEDYILDCPQVGMINVKGKALYLRRIPERQWKRGYTENVVRAEGLCQREVREIGLQTPRLNQLPVIEEVYNPSYLRISDGLIGMKKGKIFSFAISRKFAVGLKWDAKFPVIYYKEWIVGWVEGEEIKLPKSSHHLFEELSQYSVCRRV